jgi:UDP-glucose 4-epimerase
MNGRILLTGGAGYIGSHVAVELAMSGHRPIVLDDLSNGCYAAVQSASRIAGIEIPFVHGDVRSPRVLADVFHACRRRGEPVMGVVHLAGRKAVAESVTQPLAYYETNVAGTVALVSAMKNFGVRRLVFSSSATVYGQPAVLPLDEGQPVRPCTPYGRSKSFVEQMLCDVCDADSHFEVVALRYFNPIGAHPSAAIGEAPRGEPANLFPLLVQAAAGRRVLTIYGADYATRDGTAARDYLHVMDLARGHVHALDETRRGAGMAIYNLGTGTGTTVLELVRAFEASTGMTVPLQIARRRPGDVPELWADATKAQRELGWKATCSLRDMCLDGWRWRRENPHGYESTATQAGRSRGRNSSTSNEHAAVQMKA